MFTSSGTFNTFPKSPKFSDSVNRSLLKELEYPSSCANWRLQYRFCTLPFVNDVPFCTVITVFVLWCFFQAPSSSSIYRNGNANIGYRTINNIYPSSSQHSNAHDSSYCCCGAIGSMMHHQHALLSLINCLLFAVLSVGFLAALEPPSTSAAIVVGRFGVVLLAFPEAVAATLT